MSRFDFDGDWFLDPAQVSGFKHLEDLPERTAAGCGEYVSSQFLQGDKYLLVQEPSSGAPP